MVAATRRNSRATPEATKAATERLEAVIARDPGLAGATVDEVLRVIPDRRGIFAGDLNGRRVVYRLYIDPDDAGAAERQWAELTRVSPDLASGPWRVNAPVHLNARERLIVVGFAKGEPLMSHLWSMKAKDRVSLLVRGPDWLRAYCRSSERDTDADFRRWLARATERARLQADPDLRRDEARVLAALHGLAAWGQGQMWRQAICHGDFHPNNLIYDVETGCLTGIDTGGSAPIPIYKDMARYLVHFARRRMALSGGRVFGVDQAAFSAFADAFALSEIEQTRFLPFMIGVDALQRVPRKGLKERQVAQVRKLYHGLLRDLIRKAPSGP